MPDPGRMGSGPTENNPHPHRPTKPVNTPTMIRNRELRSFCDMMLRIIFLVLIASAFTAQAFVLFVKLQDLRNERDTGNRKMSWTTTFIPLLILIPIYLVYTVWTRIASLHVQLNGTARKRNGNVMLIIIALVTFITWMLLYTFVFLALQRFDSKTKDITASWKNEFIPIFILIMFYWLEVILRLVLRLGCCHTDSGVVDGSL